jgi:hypothetical protein
LVPSRELDKEHSVPLQDTEGSRAIPQADLRSAEILMQITDEKRFAAGYESRTIRILL